MNILEVLKLAATVIAEVETSGTCNVSKCGCCYESATCCPVCEMPYAGHKKGCKLEEAKIELDFKIREIEGAGDRALEGLIPPRLLKRILDVTNVVGMMHPQTLVLSLLT